ncbi:carbohydrate ABC transporter permease [Saliphagus infecundisoli]|uniref:Carbohydrate ABC transporter permease n=1 Tax=Saliphagus infecundisoli TaxID=1849069 RepID=A0ABD5QAX0_9EURY|nr:sugar ABC transporter permease [Saliphagus infecundisoli]
MSVSSVYQTYKSQLFNRYQSAGTTFRENRFEYLLVMPALILIGLLLWVPFIRGVYMSLFNWPLLGENEWIGLGNYEFLFGWEPFWTSVRVTLIYSINTVIHMVLGVVAALLVYHMRGIPKKLTSGAFLISYAMPPVVTGTLWLYLVDPEFGPIMTLLVDIGILSDPIFWKSSGTAALVVVTLVAGWTFWPFVFLIVLASREGISKTQYEVARMYGASRLQQTLKITLPQLKSAILVAVSLRLIWNLAKVSQPFQMTTGGPGYETSVLGLLLYRDAYFAGQMGRAYSVGIILLLITLGAVMIFLREFERQSGEVEF